MMNTALVIIAKENDQYDDIYRESHEMYANRYNYRIIVVKEDLIYKRKYKIKSIHYYGLQKWGVIFQPWIRSYRYAIVIDSHIMIHPNAPGIHQYFDQLQENIGCIDTHLYTSTYNIDISETEEVLFSKRKIYTSIIIAQPSLHSHFAKTLVEDVLVVMKSIYNKKKFNCFCGIPSGSLYTYKDDNHIINNIFLKNRSILLWLPKEINIAIILNNNIEKTKEIFREYSFIYNMNKDLDIKQIFKDEVNRKISIVILYEPCGSKKICIDVNN